MNGEGYSTEFGQGRMFYISEPDLVNQGQVNDLGLSKPCL